MHRYMYMCIGTCTYSPASVGSGAVEDRSRELATHVTAAVKRGRQGGQGLCVVRDHIIHTCTCIIQVHVHNNTLSYIHALDPLCRVGGCGSTSVEVAEVLAQGTAAVKRGGLEGRKRYRYMYMHDQISGCTLAAEIHVLYPARYNIYARLQ